MSKISGIALLLALITLGLAPGVYAHAFPDKSLPAANATVIESPSTVKIWFNSEIAPVFSTLIVKDSAGQQVSKGKGEVESPGHTLLITAVPAKLPAGKYEVYWSVIARDGHHTAGHFPFTVK